MADFTAADVEKLRELISSGMKACKDALVGTDGDFDKAVEILHIRGAKDVDKHAEYTTAEGLVAVFGNTMVEVNSGTDFVVKNQEFIDLADKVADAIVTVKANSPGELAAADLDSQTIADTTQELSAKIGEKLKLRRVATLEGDNIAVYLHRRITNLPAAVGALVVYTGEGGGAAGAAHATAVQVAALKAQYLPREDVPADRVETERAVYEKVTYEGGKPEQAIAKIVEDRLNDFYKNIVLLEQPSVADNKKAVKQLMGEAGVTLADFVRFEVGQH